MHLEEIKKANKIIYIDPRMKNGYKKLEKYLNFIDKNDFQNIFVLKTNKSKYNLIKYTKDSCKSTIYKCDINKTLNYLNNEIHENQDIQIETTIFDPSILIYNNINKNNKNYLKLCNKIYNALQETNQKNCVIYFSLYAQKYKDLIEHIEIKNILEIN